jgi:aminopeptidase N
MQEFSADLNSRPVKRIEDVGRLRTAQFVEDAGAMAHPIRPDAYIKMDNFYTLTVYEKGAEIVRLYNTLLGPAGFRCARALKAHACIGPVHLRAALERRWHGRLSIS